jgi:hypothetical protein
MIEPLGGYQQTPTPKRSRKGIYLLVAFLVLMPIGTLVLVGGGLASTFFMGVKTTDEYKCAITTLRASPEAKRLLGEHMEPSFFASGAFSLKSNDRNVTFTTKVTGPKSTGELSVVSVRDASDSDFLMSLEVGGQRTAIHTDKYPCSE